MDVVMQKNKFYIGYENSGEKCDHKTEFFNAAAAQEFEVDFISVQSLDFEAEPLDHFTPICPSTGSPRSGLIWCAKAFGLAMVRSAPNA